MVLAALMLGSAVMLLSLTSAINFVTDEWNLLFLRPGWGPASFLEPFHEHIIIAPAFLYKVLQTILGMDSNRPYQVLAILGFLAVGLLLFVWMRRRTGDWAALIGVAIILFLGAAFEDLLWAFQIGYYGSLACGLGALIALDRDDRKGDIAASILLVGSLTFSSLGMPFVAGAVAEWLLNPRDRRRRWFVPGAAIIFYALWWLGWGHEAESAVSLSNLTDVPRFSFEAAAAGVTSMLGLATGDGSEAVQPHLVWGRIGLVVLLVLSAWRLRRLGRIPPGVLVAGSIALAFFVLAALGQNEARLPTSSRYQLPGVLFLLLFFAEILRGVKLRTPLLILASLAVVVTSAMGINLMKDQAEGRWEPATVWTATYLGVVAEAGEAVDPATVINLGPGSEIPVDRFLDEVEASGNPGFTVKEIEAEEDWVRAYADETLVNLTGIQLIGIEPEGPAFANCSSHPAGTVVPLREDDGLVEIRSEGDAELGVSLSRFGDPPGRMVGSTFAGSMGWLDLPEISEGPPWKVTADGPFAVCHR